ncbi:hypothetical protein NZA98_01930, partial [Escherichia coli]|nr:hypothetical protein [Escherichia coli]
ALMKEFFTLAELASARLPELPVNQSGLHKLAVRENWRGYTDRVRRVSGKTNASWEYHISLLPRVAQTRLLIIHSAPTNDGADLATEKRQQ